MKKTKFIALALSALLSLTLLAGCSSDTSSSAPAASSAPASSAPTSEASSAPAAEGLTVTDMTGREITLDGPAEKIVALTAADVEILYALGAGDTLVGRGEYCDYPAEVLEVTSVQSGYETNVEQIIELAPDVVLMATMAQPEEQIQQMEDAGIRVIVSDAHDIAGTYTAIELIGAVVGKDAEAATLIDEMKASFAAIEEKVPEATEEMSVYFEVSPLEFGLWTAGNNTFMNEIATMLNLTNVFEDLDGWVEVSQEQVIERNPTYIFTIAMYFGEGPEPTDEIMGRDGWSAITAVANGDVFSADSNAISRPGPRLVDAANSMYDLLYGAGGVADDMTADSSMAADSSAAA